MIQAPSSCKHRPTQTPPAAAASTPTGLSSLLQTATAMLPPGVALNVVPSSSMPMMIPQPKAPAAAAPHQQPKKPEHHHHHHRHNHHHNHPMAGPKSRALRFHRKYAELCRRRNVPPLQDLRERSKSVLDFYCDRVRLDDWTLVLQALMGDTQLVGLGVRARKPCAHGERYCVNLRSFGDVFSNILPGKTQSSRLSTTRRNAAGCAISPPSVPSSFSTRSSR